MLEKIPSVISRAYVTLITIIGFIIFSGSSVSEILNNIGGIFGIGVSKFADLESLYCLKNYAAIFIIAIIGATPIMKNIVSKISKKVSKLVNVIEPVFLTTLLIVCISYLVDGSFNPFLYFRF